MPTHDFRIHGTARPLRPAIEHVGSRVYAACTRCGRRRQIKSDRALPDDGLCIDCKQSDPDVWRINS